GLSVKRGPAGRVAEFPPRVRDRGVLRDELCPRALDICFVRLDRAGGGVGGGACLFRVVLRDDAALGELRLAFRRQLLILGVRGVATELRFGLRQQRLVAGQV